MSRIFKFFFLACCVVYLQACSSVTGQKYTPDWKSLDSRPLPDWFDKAKIGIFVHWGVFSVPAYKTEWFWSSLDSSASNEFRDFVRTNYSSSFKYQDFAPQFRAELWKPDEWAKLFADSGAKYVVLTSKHHEGFTLWPSKYSWNWNAGDVGPKRDLVKDFEEAILKQNLTFGLYHSLFEWFNPNYLYDQSQNFTTKTFVETKVKPQLYELVNTYQPQIVWSDGDWVASEDYWQSKDFLTWLYNDSPVKDTVVTNDRWGIGTACQHGGFLVCQDRYSPGKLQARKWENAMTIDKTTWGMSRVSNLANYYTTVELINEVVKTVACGGNILINVGPRSDGTIDAIFQDRLTNLGAWLKMNGAGIYNTKPCPIQQDTKTQDVWYTCNEDNSAVFATFSKWPWIDELQLHLHRYIPGLGDRKLYMLKGGSEQQVQFKVADDTTVIALNKDDVFGTLQPWMLVFRQTYP